MFEAPSVTGLPAPSTQQTASMIAMSENPLASAILVATARESG
jgi:hypothetical protein